ncbi:MAG: hypothetical protein LUI60_06290 [Clostridia bacterium]|nr:hypothetical protein [Clostridia bacterium]
MEDIIELFSRYGIDFALMAAAAAAITVALDYAVFNKLNLSGKALRAKKLLPYVLGVLFYTIYGIVCNSCISCFFENLADIFQQGLAVGTLGYLLCRLADKIISGKSVSASDTEAVVSLIDGYISDGKTESTARLLCDAAKNGGSGEIENILEENAAEGVTQAELEVLKALILSYFENTSA